MWICDSDSDGNDKTALIAQLSEYSIKTLIKMMIHRGIFSSSVPRDERLRLIREDKNIGVKLRDYEDYQIEHQIIEVEVDEYDEEAMANYIHPYDELYGEKETEEQKKKAEPLVRMIGVSVVRYSDIRGGLCGERFASLYSLATAGNKLDFLLQHFEGRIFRKSSIEQAQGGRVIVQYLPDHVFPSARMGWTRVTSSAHAMTDSICNIFYKANGFYRDLKFPLLESIAHREHLYVLEDLWVNLGEV